MKILILCHTFYPDTNVASIRVGYFAKYLAEQGFQPVIVCKDYGFDAPKQELDNQIHPDIEVIRIGKVKRLSAMNEKASLNKGHALSGRVKRTLSGKIKQLQRLLISSGVSTFLIPNHQLLFWAWHMPKVSRIVADHQIRVVLSSSPQHATHWLAKALKVRHQFFWVADFRDPYIIDQRYAPKRLSKLLFPLHQHFEKSIYSNANLITHAIPSHYRWARRSYPDAKAKIRLLLNGIPDSVFDAKRSVEKKSSEVIKLISVGRIESFEAEVLSKAVKRLTEYGWPVKLFLVGAKPNSSELIDNLLQSSVDVVGPVQHNRAIQYMRDADVLISFLSYKRSHTKCLTSKLFEYVAVGKPILCINPTVPDKLFFSCFKHITSIEASTSDQVFFALNKMLTNEPKTLSESELKVIRESWSRKAQVKQLAQWIEHGMGYYD